MSSMHAVIAAGAAVAVALPLLAPYAASAPLALLRALNAAAFGVNVAAVSVPGRLDGERGDDKAREKDRALIAPSGWAFAIWAPIYLGEAAFVAMQLLGHSEALDSVLPALTASFVAANLCQSLWCASFRPAFTDGWKKYVPVAALGATALSLSHVHAVVSAAPSSALLSAVAIPLTMHFGWTTAATLVNLNVSFAMDSRNSDTAVIALGHGSAIAATTLGVSVTLAYSSPAYALTVAWALAACADGVGKRAAREGGGALERGASVQRVLCALGSATCAVVACVSMVN
jgi:hypothetical protein